MKLGLADITKKCVGAPYALGKENEGGGFDCLSLILWFCEKVGIDPPESFEGVTRESYAKLYKLDRDKANAVFLRFIATLGDEIPASRAFAGDILVCTPKTSGGLAVGIHGGGDNLLAAFESRGVTLANLRAYRILKAYRIRGVKS